MSISANFPALQSVPHALNLVQTTAFIATAPKCALSLASHVKSDAGGDVNTRCALGHVVNPAIEILAMSLVQSV